MKKSRTGQLTVKIFTPFKVYYEGKARSVTAANKTGEFDVLLDHANFFSVLEAGQVEVDTGSRKLSFPLDRGVIKVTDNRVTLFAGL